MKRRYKWSTVNKTNWILQVELDLLLKLSGLIEVKGIIHAKLKILSAFTQPHVITKLCLYSEEHERKCFEGCYHCYLPYTVMKVDRDRGCQAPDKV